MEGNIASGKSTLLDVLAKSLPDFAISPEPVETWQRVGNTPPSANDAEGRSGYSSGAVAGTETGNLLVR